MSPRVHFSEAEIERTIAELMKASAAHEGRDPAYDRLIKVVAPAIIRWQLTESGNPLVAETDVDNGIALLTAWLMCLLFGNTGASTPKARTELVGRLYDAAVEFTRSGQVISAKPDHTAEGTA